MRRSRKRKPLKKMSGQMKRKLAGLFGLVVLALVGLGIRITYINASQGEQYKKQVLTRSQQKYNSHTLAFKRGDILDKNGTVLATSEKVYNVILDCKVVNSNKEYIDPTVKALVEVLGIQEADVRTLLESEDTKGSQYQIILKGISIKDKKAFEKNKDTSDEALSKEEIKEKQNIKGVWFEENYKRIYPFNSLACDLIGFVYSANQADWGIEGYYSDTLNGVDGRQYGYFNDNADVEQTIIEPKDGYSVVSTIDLSVQQTVEKYIAELEGQLAGGPNGSKGAKNIGVIIANPQNGEILAMASSDGFDLNNPRDLSSFYTEEEIKAMNDEQTMNALFEVWQNYCITSAFEPGSTVKPLTVGAALEDGTVTGDETYYCDGGQTVGGTLIKCSNIDGHGDETLGDGIKNSCNDVMMQLAAKMGADEFLKYQEIFNFGRKTGLDLPGEATGVLHTKESLNSVELATSSFGQGYTCTMIQEMAALCSVVNGGNYYQPHIVNQILDSDGSVVKNIEPVLLKQTVSKETSDLVRKYMEGSLLGGTGRYAKVAGFSGGGKTGTAQKIPRGNGKYLVSYIGFTPLEDPQVVIYVVVDEPNVAEQADSIYAQYLAKKIMTEVLPYLNIFPDESEDAYVYKSSDIAKLREFMIPFYTGQDETETDSEEETTSDEEENSNEEEDSNEDGSGDGIADTNVPEPTESDEEVEVNDLSSDGITDEEAEW